MKIIAKFRGGSYSYGLNTPSSDIDERYLFVNDQISQIVGLDKNELIITQNADEDTIGYELLHFLRLLKKGNTMCLEMMFNKDWILIDKDFEYVQEFRSLLIDSHQLYKCLKGYCQSERAFVLGSRTGVLGGKRRAHLDTYGYSFKNATQFLRLCRAGDIFFQTGEFPVNIRPFDTNGLIYSVKTEPEKYTKDKMITLMNEYEAALDTSYNNIKVVRTYSNDIANEICFKLYVHRLIEARPYFFTAC